MSGDHQAILRFGRNDLDQLKKYSFRRYPDREWGTFFEFGFRRTFWGLAISYVGGLWPEAGDLDPRVGITRFRDQYSRRAFHRTADNPLAIGVVHSHPEGSWTFPSVTDDDMDTYFAREFGAYGGGKPYCSLVIQRSDTTGFTFTGRVYDRGNWYPVQKMLVGGDQIELITPQGRDSLAADPIERLSELAPVRSRLVSVLGETSELRLKNSTVGIIGCSGTGSPAAHVLARAGVGGFVLVDPKRVAPSNLERLHGSTWADRDRQLYKVEVVAELIKSINPAARITTIAGNILQENVVDELLICDLLLGCTDTLHSRAQLSDFAAYYLLPSLDLGVLMEGRAGKVTTQVSDLLVHAPGLPCAFCLERIDGTEMSFELMSEEEKTARQLAAEAAIARGDDPDHYWKRRPRQLHTVGYLTTMLGALGAGYVEGWLTGTFGPPHTWFQFDIGQQRFGVVAPPPPELDSSCTCKSLVGWGDAARGYRNVAIPQHWPQRGLLLRRDKGGVLS